MTTEGGEMALAEHQRIPEWTFGERLAKARRDAGFEQEEMAQKLGVNRVTLSSWENNRKRPRDLLTTASEWALATGVPVAWLLTGSSWDRETAGDAIDHPDGAARVLTSVR